MKNVNISIQVDTWADPHFFMFTGFLWQETPKEKEIRPVADSVFAKHILL